MRLDRDICLGGRFNNKEVLGIIFNGNVIYPNARSSYITVFASEGTVKIPNLWDYKDKDYTVNKYVDEEGLIVTEIALTDIRKLPTGIDFYRNETVKKIIKLRCDYVEYGRDPNIPSTFAYCKALEYVDISELNINNATNLDWMFSHCESLITIDGLDTLDTSHITSMNIMFSYCKQLESIDLSSFDTSLITSVASMFMGCSSLKKVDLSSWHTDSLNSTQYMFYLCSALEEVDMRNFDMSNVPSNTTNINGAYDNFQMFAHCYKLHTLRLDNCNYSTISKIINSRNFPTGLINGETRKIYCKRENVAGLTAPDGWEFIYIEQIIYDESTEKLDAPEVMLELEGEQLLINKSFIVYDAENENLNIN